MPLSPERYLQTQSDGYVQVRNADHKLLGCIHASLHTDDFMQTAIGQMEVRAALIFCLVPSQEQLVQLPCWEGFIPAQGALDATAPIRDPNDQSDLGEAP